MAMSGRIKRKSINGKGPLAVEQREGYKRRIVNLHGNNLEEALELGYKVVTKEKQKAGAKAGAEDDLSSAHTFKVSKNDDLKAVLMEIPLELYNENKRAKEQDVDDIEARLAPEGSNESYGTLNIKRK